MVFCLIHISDIHLGPLPRASIGQLMSKRVTGYINWQRNRAKTMEPAVLEGLVRSVQARNPDHIAVTGDLMNIGLPEEIENTGRWLEALGAPDLVSVVPGNHDAYVRGILVKALRRWSLYVTGDDGKAAVENDNFPYMRVRGKIAIIGVNSAIATAPFAAAGRVSKAQCARMEGLLKQAERQGLFRVIMIHHPPVRGAAKPQKRLFGIGIFQKAVHRAGAELILHGHTHLPQRHIIAGPRHPIPVIGVPSASEGLGAHRPASTFNVFEISGNAQTGWLCQLTPHGLTQLTSPHTPQTTEQIYPN